MTIARRDTLSVEPVAAMNSLLQEARHDITTIAAQYAEQGNANAFANALYDLMEQWHSEAAHFGRVLGGDRSPFEEDDREFGRIAASEDLEFLDAFLTDIKKGRYRDEEGNVLPGLAARAQLYADAAKRSFQEAFVLTMPADSEIYWVLGGEEKHCPECPYYASQSPYTPDSLPTVPGAGETTCRSNCKCHLEIGGKASRLMSSD